MQPCMGEMGHLLSSNASPADSDSSLQSSWLRLSHLPLPLDHAPSLRQVCWPVKHSVNVMAIGAASGRLAVWLNHKLVIRRKRGEPSNVQVDDFSTHSRPVETSHWTRGSLPL